MLTRAVTAVALLRMRGRFDTTAHYKLLSMPCYGENQQERD